MLQVRDRATFYLAALGAGAEEEASAVALPMLLGSVNKPLGNLENALREYAAGECLEPFNIESVAGDGLPKGLTAIPGGGKANAPTVGGGGGASGVASAASAVNTSATEVRTALGTF